jgi:hypothetical protein
MDNGYAAEAGRRILGVDYIVDPPTLVIRRQSISPNSSGDWNIYLDPLFPLLEKDWAEKFWGTNYVGDAFSGDVAWKYYQRKLFDLYQEQNMPAFYQFLELFL